MDPLDAVESLARRARGERPPETNADVAGLLRVARREQVGALPLFPLAWSAVGAALAASIVLTISLRTGVAQSTPTASTDSVAQLFAPTQVDMP